MIPGTWSVYFLYVAGSVTFERAIQYAGIGGGRLSHGVKMWRDWSPTMLTRRSFVAGAALGSVAVFVKAIRAADYTFTQFHNQTATSSLHQRLVEMWAAIRAETGGRVETQVYAQNNRIAGSDPAALKMLVSGEIQFFTLMGGILGTLVLAAEVQQVPYAFRS